MQEALYGIKVFFELHDVGKRVWIRNFYAPYYYEMHITSAKTQNPKTNATKAKVGMMRVKSMCKEIHIFGWYNNDMPSIYVLNRATTAVKSSWNMDDYSVIILN